MIVVRDTTDFAALNSNQFINEVNDSAIIAQCIEISTSDTICNIHFDSPVDSSEELILDQLIVDHLAHDDLTVYVADTFQMNNVTNCYQVVTRPLTSLVKNISTDILDQWTPYTGNLSGFDISTGIWTCMRDGLYFHNLILTSIGAHLNDKVHIKFIDPTGAFRFGMTNIISDTHTHAFMGNGGYWQAGTQLQLNLECDTSDMDITLMFKVMMIMGA